MLTGDSDADTFTASFRHVVPEDVTAKSLADDGGMYSELGADFADTETLTVELPGLYNLLFGDGSGRSFGVRPTAVCAMGVKAAVAGPAHAFAGAFDDAASAGPHEVSYFVMPTGSAY